MAYKAYIGKAKTGKTPEDFRKLAKKKGLVKYDELLTCVGLWARTRSRQRNHSVDTEFGTHQKEDPGRR